MLNAESSSSTQAMFVSIGVTLSLIAVDIPWGKHRYFQRNFHGKIPWEILSEIRWDTPWNIPLRISQGIFHRTSHKIPQDPTRSNKMIWEISWLSHGRCLGYPIEFPMGNGWNTNLHSHLQNNPHELTSKLLHLQNNPSFTKQPPMRSV